MTISILVVDDYEANTQIMSVLLEMRGYMIETAHDGHPALQRLLEKPFDLVITDDRMSLMNGFELATRMRQQDDLRDIPIILVSAYDYEADLPQRLTEAGINAFLPRPYTPDALWQCVQSVVKRPPADENR